jgi:hypothetical protein
MTSSTNNTSIESPIEYLTVTFQDGPMGLRAAERRERIDWILGNTVLSDFGDFGRNSQAKQQGARALDVFVEVNGEYIAFLSHEAVLSRLKSASRPLKVVFARPKQQQWMRCVDEIDSIIRSGELDKMTGLTRLTLSRWQEREFTLTRNSISYSEDGTLRKKIGLEDVVRIQQNPSGLSGTDRDTSFALVTVEREFVLRAQNTLDKLTWMHAIEVAQNRAFDVSLPYDALFAEADRLSTLDDLDNSPPLPPARNSANSSTPSSNNTNNNIIIDNKKLSAKRAPPPVPNNTTPPSSATTTSTSIKTTPKTATVRESMREAMRAESGPYWMLAQTRVIINNTSSPNSMNNNTIPDLQLPPPPANITSVYDFKLEQSILQKANGR